MAQPDIVIYSASWCPYCARALALLKSKDVQVTVIDVDAQPDKRAEMQSRTGRRTVPQIYIGDRHIGGCDDLHELDRAGGRDPLLRPGA